MASLLFIRTVWWVWWISTCYLFGASLSGWLFSRDANRHKRFGLNILTTAVWPVMVLSSKGRTRLVKIVKGIV